jgi:hypothetical protein
MTIIFAVAHQHVNDEQQFIYGLMLYEVIHKCIKPSDFHIKVSCDAV